MYDATTLGQLRVEATQLRDIVRGSQLPVKALHFDAVAVAATQWAAIIAHRSNEPLAERIRGVEFRAAILNLSQQYAQINPNALPENSPAFFLDTLWGATRSVDIKEDGAQELLQFLSGVPNPVQLLQLSTQLLKAVQGIPELEQDIRNPQFIRQLLELGKAYLTLNPIVVTPSSLDFFLNTLRPPATTGLSPDAYLSALNARLQAGTPQLEQFLGAASTPEKRLETLTLATNLLKATKITATGESGLFLQEHAREPEFLKEVIELGKTYVPLNPIGTAPQDFFLETLLNATTQADITQGAEQFGTFIRGTAGIGEVDPTGLMEFSSSLLTVASQTSYDLLQVQNKEFYQELMGVGRTYLGLQPNASGDNSPLNFYLDTLLKDQRQRVELKEEGASQQTLSQLKEQAITKAVAEFGGVIYGSEEPFGTNSPGQRAKVMELGQNLLELTARVPELEPQKTNPEFLQELLKLGKLYSRLQSTEALPDTAPESFLHQLWQTQDIQSTVLQQAQNFFKELGSSIAVTGIPLFALRLLIANERRPVVANVPPVETSTANPELPDLTLQIAQLAKAYGDLNPQKGYGNSVSLWDNGNSGAFLDTLWSANNDADALGNLAEIQDGARELNEFLLGNNLSSSLFKTADHPKILSFVAQTFQATKSVTELTEQEKQNPRFLEELLEAARGYAALSLPQVINAQYDPDFFLSSIWTDLENIVKATQNADSFFKEAPFEETIFIPAIRVEEGPSNGSVTLQFLNSDDYTSVILGDMGIATLSPNVPAIPPFNQNFGSLQIKRAGGEIENIPNPPVLSSPNASFGEVVYPGDTILYPVFVDEFRAGPNSSPIARMGDLQKLAEVLKLLPDVIETEFAELEESVKEALDQFLKDPVGTAAFILVFGLFLQVTPIGVVLDALDVLELSGTALINTLALPERIRRAQNEDDLKAAAISVGEIATSIVGVVTIATIGTGAVTRFGFFKKLVADPNITSPSKGFTLLWKIMSGRSVFRVLIEENDLVKAFITKYQSLPQIATFLTNAERRAGDAFAVAEVANALTNKGLDLSAEPDLLEALLQVIGRRNAIVPTSEKIILDYSPNLDINVIRRIFVTDGFEGLKLLQDIIELQARKGVTGIVDRLILPQNSGVISLLSQHTDLLEKVFQAGVNGVDDLQQILTRANPDVLADLLRIDGLDIKLLKDFLLSFSQVSPERLLEELKINVITISELQEIVSKLPFIHLIGTADFAHEPLQALRYINLENGGEIEFYGSSSQGVEGVFRPILSSSLEIPISLKLFHNVESLTSLLREIRRNSNQAQAVGISNATLYGEPIQFSAFQLADFSRNGPIYLNIVQEGVFSTIILKGNDGVVKITPSDVTIIR